MTEDPAASHGSGRLAVVLAQHRAAAPPGVAPPTFARACLADTYEVLAQLAGVTAAIAASADDESVAELMWPGSVAVPAPDAPAVVRWWTEHASGTDTALVLVPADAPDLPALVVAKVFQALARADVAVASQVGGTGCVALGLRRPVPAYVLAAQLDLDDDPYARLSELAPRRNLVVRTPGWHRLRTPGDVDRLDPGLEGWEETRHLLTAGTS